MLWVPCWISYAYMFKFIKKCDNTDHYVLAHIIEWALAQMAPWEQCCRPQINYDENLSIYVQLN